MSEVTVVGLGEMGTAIAGALLEKGRNITVWNRTRAKAEGLAARDASAPSTAAEAIAVSPAVIICVTDYPASGEILSRSSLTALLQGKLVIQLSSGIPSEARQMGKFIELQGADYVDGAIFAWPRQIGTDAVILASGKPRALATARPLLDLLGEVAPIGEEIGGASALFSGALAYLAGHWIGFAHGARVCESEGLTAQLLGETLARIAPALGEDNLHMGRVVTHGRYEKPESRLRTAGNDIARLVDQAASAQLSTAFPEFATAIFRRAMEAGLGDEEHVAIAKILGPKPEIEV